MDSDEEYEYSEQDFDENAEIDGYDSEEPLGELIETDKDNIERRESLLSQKMSVILRYSSNQLDRDIFFKELNVIDRQLSNMDALSDAILEKFIDQELELSELLLEYSNKVKAGGKLTPEEVTKVQDTKSELSKLIEEYFSNSEEILPEDSRVIDYDEEGYTLNWQALEDREKKELESLSKKYSIKKPKRNGFNSDADYLNAVDKYYKKLMPYIPGYLTRIDPTKIGTQRETIQNIPLMSRTKQEMMESDSGVRLTKQQIELSTEISELKKE